MDKQNRNRPRYREHFDSCQREGELGGPARKVKRLRSTRWQLQNSPGDVKGSTGTADHNILITVGGIGWVGD